ncbi:NupC/NupG family nucleoside CNT transporter [Singulisphaera sp. PoT]|uniref:NupC/NupG family nucleoside CNT transporter n=1 Tax=Singulisphaera sp. PoT TaxID=3411797 RepID=UPI003BF5FB7C
MKRPVRPILWLLLGLWFPASAGAAPTPAPSAVERQADPKKPGAAGAAKGEESPKPQVEIQRVDKIEVNEIYEFELGGRKLSLRMPDDEQSQRIFDRVRCGFGILIILGIAGAMSSHPQMVSRRVVFWGLVLQWIFALLVLRVPAGEAVLRHTGKAVERVLACSDKGAEFVFGSQLTRSDGPAGFVFAFRVLPAVIFVAALFASLYHIGIMQWVVRGIGWIMVRIMGTSGAESLNIAASLFLGQTEAPLTIRPYLARLTNSELLTVMTSGMAHVSGGVMVAYFAAGIEPRHILTAVIMTAPGTILLSKIMVPETERPETLGTVSTTDERPDANLLDAVSRGTRDGLHLALNIGAMLIAFISIISLINLGLAQVHQSLESLLGTVLAPVAYMLGVPWADAAEVGGLLGTRTVLNELIAFTELGTLKSQITPRSFTIATYALCGFANLSSIGIQLGGIGTLAPERRADLARLGFRALVAGTLANFLSACIAGILL